MVSLQYNAGQTGFRPSDDIPHQQPFGPRLNEERAGEDDPVHEPWRELGRIRGLEGLVAGEEGEQERGDGPVAALGQWETAGRKPGLMTHDRIFAKMSNMVTRRRGEAAVRLMFFSSVTRLSVSVGRSALLAPKLRVLGVKWPRGDEDSGR